MRIIPYRELASPDELLSLFHLAFWWPFNPREFEKTITADPRLHHSPVGYAGIQNQRVVGFVGVMDIATRTQVGAEETVGGIWGVVTHPAHARTGISTALMHRSHAYFRAEGYRFALLNTSKSLVAYSLYRKLGYSDVMTYPKAYKVIPEKAKIREKPSRKTKLDWRKILEMFNHATQAQPGFTVRGPRYGEMLETRKRIHPEKSIVRDNGYALLKEEGGNVVIQEIVAFTKDETDRLILHSEETATNTVIAEAVLNADLRKAYVSRGFMLLKDSYDLLMAKPLDTAKFREIYGRKFYAAATDFF